MNRYAATPTTPIAAALSLLLSLALPACGQPAQLPTEGPSPIFDDSDADAPPATGYRTETLLDGMAHPWGLAYLPDGAVLITQRPGGVGGVVLAEPDPTLFDGRGGFKAPVPVANTPQSSALGQGGMMEVSLHPQFATNGLVYLAYATGDARANRTVLARMRLVRDGDGSGAGARFEDVREIFRVTPDKPGGQHFGARIVWLPDGTLLLSIGDGGNPPTRVGGRLARDNPQYLDNTWGKVLRLNDDGTAPANNPFIDNQEHPETAKFIYSYGHRNIQGMAIDPATGNVWATEHGALGGDELNLIEAGQNYGWPRATYSIHYNRQEISEHVTLEGMVDPVLVWTPVLAASGLAFYSSEMGGEAFEAWQGDLFAGGLVSQQVRRVMLGEGNGQDTEVQGNEKLAFGARIRDVRQGPDGFLYVLTDSRNGKLVRVVPE